MVVFRVELVSPNGGSHDAAAVAAAGVLSVRSPKEKVLPHVHALLAKVGLGGDTVAAATLLKRRGVVLCCGKPCGKPVDCAQSFAQNGLLANGDVIRVVRTACAAPKAAPAAPLSTMRTPSGCSGTEKVYYLAGLDRDVAVHQNWRVDGAGTGSVAWDASFLLAAFLDEVVAAAAAAPRVALPAPAGQTAVVELGAGVGLPSVAAAHLGFRRVVATDGDARVLPLLRRNMAAAAAAAAAAGAACEGTEALHYLWGDAEQGAVLQAQVGEGPLLVLCADVLYRGSHKYWPELAAELRRLVCEGGGVCLVSATDRGGADCPKLFFRMVESAFRDGGWEAAVTTLDPPRVACTMPQMTHLYHVTAAPLTS